LTIDTDTYTYNNIDTYTDIHNIIVAACVLALQALILTFFWFFAGNAGNVNPNFKLTNSTRF